MAANPSSTTTSSSANSKPVSTDKDKETLRAVLQFLKKKNLSVSIAASLQNLEKSIARKLN